MKMKIRQFAPLVLGYTLLNIGCMHGKQEQLPSQTVSQNIQSTAVPPGKVSNILLQPNSTPEISSTNIVLPSGIGNTVNNSTSETPQMVRGSQPTNATHTATNSVEPSPKTDENTCYKASNLRIQGDECTQQK